MMTTTAVLLMALFPAAQDEERVQKLIQVFSDGNKEERNRAVDDLAKIGQPALEALRKAATSSDLEVKGLAQQAIEKIEWVGVDKLRKYAKETFDETANVEQSKIKTFARWLPDTRLYEITGGAPANANGVMMGFPAPRSLFAVRKFEPGFHRLLVRGVTSANSINALIRMAKIAIPDEDAALDFAIAYLELSTAGSNQNAAMMMSGASRLEKTSDGWALISSVYGSSVQFKTKDGMLTDIVQRGNPYGGYNAHTELAEEKARLEVEKLRLEVELLKKQLDKK